MRKALAFLALAVLCLPATSSAQSLSETVQALEKNNQAMKNCIVRLGEVYSGTNAQAMMEGFPVLMYASKLEDLSFALYKISMSYTARPALHKGSGPEVLDIVYEGALARAKGLLERAGKIPCGQVGCSHKAEVLKGAQDLVSIIAGRVESRAPVQSKQSGDGDS